MPAVQLQGMPSRQQSMPSDLTQSLYQRVWVMGVQCLFLASVASVFNPLHSITLKELYPIVLASAVWEHQWSGPYILCHSDNAEAVCHVNCLHAHDPLTSHLLRWLALFMAVLDFRIRVVHITGRLNTGADQLS